MPTLPSDFILSMQGILGEEASLLLDAIGGEQPASIRLNRSKTEWEGGEPVPWCPSGRYLDGRLTYTFDPLFHAGAYYVQEASSMFLDQVVRNHVDAPVLALDLCAAPGGKSTLLSSSLPGGSLLVANEVVRNRVPALVENLTKWGNPSVMVTNSATADFAQLGGCFDFILVDAPCSGEGMFRKDAGAIAEWSPSNVASCAQRQRTILSDAWQALRPGGLLVYSTCTYNLEENEKNVHWLIDTLGAIPLAVPTEAEWGVTGALDGSDVPVYRFLPHKTRGEGLFMAVVRKDYDDDCTAQLRHTKDKRQNVVVPQAVKDFVAGNASFDFGLDNGAYSIKPKQWRDAIAMLASQLRVVKAGTAVAAVKGRDIIPLHPLAMSAYCNRSAFTMVELSHDEAVTYLRRGALQLEGEGRGCQLVTYKSVPLGFVKRIGSRVNNLYPQEWRIMTSYSPDEMRTLV